MMLEPLIQLFDLLLEDDAVGTQLANSLLVVGVLRFEQSNVLFKLDLPALVIVDHSVFHDANHVLSLHCEVRIEEAKRFH